MRFKNTISQKFIAKNLKYLKKGMALLTSALKQTNQSSFISNRMIRDHICVQLQCCCEEMIQIRKLDMEVIESSIIYEKFHRLVCYRNDFSHEYGRMRPDDLWCAVTNLYPMIANFITEITKLYEDPQYADNDISPTA